MNKHILTLSLALAGACTFTLSAVAEDAKPPGGPGGKGGPGGPGERRPPPNPEDRLKHMKETLGLSDEQAGKILPILQKGQETMKSIHDDAALQPDAKREKAMEARKSTMEEVGAILTPEQKEKMKAEMEKRRAEGGGPGGPGKGGPGKPEAK